MLYDGAQAEKTAPRLEDMCNKIEQLKKEVSADGYAEKHRPKVEAVLKSFIERTNAVANSMSNKEQQMAKQAYATLDSLVRRFKMNQQLANALSGVGQKIAASGHSESICKNKTGLEYNGRISKSGSVDKIRQLKASLLVNKILEGADIRKVFEDAVSENDSKKAEIQEFVQELNDILAQWDSKKRKELVRVIYSETSIGDAFVFKGNSGDVITYTKIAPNQWKDDRVGGSTCNALSLSDTLLIMNTGKWSFISK